MTPTRKPSARTLNWGRRTLPKLRQQAGLTLEELAERADIALGTLRGIEAGRIPAKPAQRQALRTVVHLAKLYPPGSLVVPFADVQKRDVVRDALKEFAERRRSPTEFVDHRYPKATEEARARHIDWTADEAATALALLRRIKQSE
jgi:transcriptional regulator with XRE-family HTH domain